MRIVAIGAALTALLVAGPASAAEVPPPYPIGLAELHVAHVERPLDGRVWYPSLPEGEPERLGENRVWRGFDARPDAPVAAGRFPLLVLSHGLFGNYWNQSWLAAALAESGYIVAAANHPGTSTWARDPEAAAALWQRPKDLSRVIDALLDDPRFTDALATDQIAVAGHSLGGYTVMALAGARYDPARHRRYCAAHGDRADCRFIRDSAVGVAPGSTEALGADLGDPRLRAVISFELGLTQGFDPESLAQIDIPVLVIGAGIPLPILPVEAESRALAALLPAATTRYLEPMLKHYDFLGVCKPGAQAAIAREDPGEEFVCENGGDKRAALHDEIVTVVRQFLEDAGLAPNRS